MNRQQTLLLTISFVFLLFFTSKAFGNIIISGTYEGQNLRISDPVSDDGFGFSTVKIVINGNIVPLKFDISEAEIDFTRLGLTPGTKVEIVISYENSSTPIIFNPEAIRDFALINTSEIHLDTMEPETRELIPNDRSRTKY